MNSVVSLEDRIKSVIREISDFPKQGINFKDISSIFLNPTLTKDIIEDFKINAGTLEPDMVVGVESRGFLIGPLIAQALGIPFVMVRKRGRLPGNTIAHTYDLEYGSDTIEIHSEDIIDDCKVLVVDDILATGGTASATAHLIEQAGANVVGFFFLANLTYLNGFDRLENYSDKVYASVEY